MNATARDGSPRSTARVLRVGTGMIILALVVLVVVRPRMSINAYSPLLVGALLVAGLLAWFFAADVLASRVRQWLPTARAVRAAATVLVILNALTATGVGALGAYRMKWDARVFPVVAGQPPEQWGSWYVEYFSRYPNNHAFLGWADLAIGSGRIGLGYLSFMALTAGVVSSLTAVALFRTVSLTRSGRWGVASLVLLLLLVSFSPWMGVAYTDMAAVWVPVTAVWCIVEGRRRGWITDVALTALAGAVLGLGYLIKTTPVVGLVAALVVLGSRWSSWRERPFRTAGTVAGLVVGAAVGTVGVNWTLARTVPMPALEQGVQASPWTYVAAGQETTYKPNSDRVLTYGGYSADIDTRTWNKPVAEQDHVSRSVIAREFHRRGVAGTAAFALDKFLFNNGDGMFWAYGEGDDMHASRIITGPAAAALATVNAPDGVLYPVRVHLTQVLWLGVLTLTGVGLVRKRTTAEGDDGAAIELMIWNLVGIAAFMLLFQGRSRYLFGHVPVVIALATSVAPIVRPSKVSRRLRARLRRSAPSA